MRWILARDYEWWWDSNCLWKWLLNFTVSENNLWTSGYVLKMQISGQIPYSVDLQQAQEFAVSNESLQATQILQVSWGSFLETCLENLLD